MGQENRESKGPVKRLIHSLKSEKLSTFKNRIHTITTDLEKICFSERNY